MSYSCTSTEAVCNRQDATNCSTKEPATNNTNGGNGGKESASSTSSRQPYQTARGHESEERLQLYRRGSSSNYGRRIVEKSRNNGRGCTWVTEDHPK